MEVYQWVMVALAVGGMGLSAGAMGYAAREATRQSERNRERLDLHERSLIEHAGSLNHLRESNAELRSAVRALEGRLRGENGPRP